MPAYIKFLIIHLMSILCVFMSGKAFAQTARGIDPKILSPVAGWAGADAGEVSISEKYPEVLEAFKGKPERGAVVQALLFLENNATKIPNKGYLTLIDYSKSATEKRFIVIGLQTGNIESYNVSNGRGSDPDHDGIAQSFGNEDGSYKTSLGFFVTLEDYYSEKFDSAALRLEGVSETNSKAFERAIVIHGADYMNPAKGIYGRSLGCPALEKAVSAKVIDKIKDGSLILAYK